MRRGDSLYHADLARAGDMGAAAGAKVNALDPDKAHLTLKLLFAAIGVILKLLGRGQKSLDIYIFVYRFVCEPLDAPQLLG